MRHAADKVTTLRGSVAMFVFNPFVHDSRVLKEAATLARAGCDVRVLAVAADGLPQRERRDGFRVERVSAVPPGVGLARRALIARAAGGGSGPGQAAGAALPPREDAPPAELALRRAYASAAYASWYARALRRAVAEPADVYLAHDLDTLPVALAAAHRGGARVVYDSHELFLEQPSIPPRSRIGRRKWRAIERRGARRADRVMTVNGAIAGELARRYGIDQPVVLRNVPPYAAAPEPPPRWRERVRIGPDQRVVLFLGGLTPQRGLEQLVDAAALLPADVALLLVGPGDPAYVETLRERAGAAGLGDRARFAGGVPPAEVAAWAATGDVGVVPYRRLSLNHWLSLPTKLFEYLGAGVPVVTGAFPELRAIVEGYGVGLTCDTDDPRSIAAALARLLDDPERLAAARAAALAAARELNWERESERLLALFAELLPAAQPGAAPSRS